MLAVSPLRNQKHENHGETMENFSIGSSDFTDFSDTNLLDSIDFDDLFVGIHDGDELPDLEMDPEILAEFSASGGEESEVVNTSLSTEKIEDSSVKTKDESKNSRSLSGSGSEDGCLGNKEDEIMSKRDESSSIVTHVSTTPSTKEGEKGRKSSSQSNKNSNNNPQGKRKVKVDWTPELHRRFVQAVEQLGVDKAVPSRILELMGIDCLTRHNIASHLQKYRSHKKHLLAREAEAASWNQRRQMYGAAGAPPCGGKRDMGGAWIAPATLGFPPVTPMHHFRPLHVWGHPTVDQSLVHLWPKHLPHSPSPPPPPSWAPMPQHHHHPPLTTPPEPSYWHSHHQRVPNALTPGTPCFPQPMAATRFGAPPVPGIPPPHHAVYKVDPTRFGIPPTPPPQPGSQTPMFDFHPSKESVDAAIGDVLTKPWLPLPLGLKPPSVDGVLGELQRQGIPKIPPSCA